MTYIKNEFERRSKPDLNTLVYGKIPPQAIELEAAVIGACMLEREAFEQIMEIIPSHECFYVDAHQKAYNAMCLLFNSGRNVDLLTVSEQLNKMGELEMVGGRYFLTTLTTSVTSSAHIVDHARLIMEKFMLREVIRICGAAISDAYDGITDVFELVNKVEGEVKSISDGIIQDSAVPVSETYMEILMDMETQKENRTDLTGVETGYPEINSLTNGWQDSELILLAARPSQGKTALALNFAMNSRVPTLLFSLEASKKALVKRLAAAKNNIPFSLIRQGNLNELQEKILHHAIADFNRLPIKIDDKTQNLFDIVKVCRRQKKRNPDLKLILIDYLQLVKVPKMGNREQEVSTISRTLKLLASELELPIIALSQLNRAVEQSGNKKPSLANLRESGSLEQDANIAMFIWHEEVGQNPNGSPQIKTWVLFEKNRDGECKPVELKFNGEIQKWLDPHDMNQSALPSFISNNYQQARTPYKDNDEPF